MRQTAATRLLREIKNNSKWSEVKERAMKLKVLIYEAAEGGYWTKVPAIPGCVSQGETLEEVKESAFR